MTTMTNKANVYPNGKVNPTLTYSDASKANLGLCFSGGGSRALTCAWGQLLGLHTLSLVDKARYISSVSGGTWASSIFTFLPNHINDEDLLGRYYPPSELSLDGKNSSFNVNHLGEYSLGQAPAATSLETLTVWNTRFLLSQPRSNYKWLWASTVANFILEPFGLRAEGDHIWTSSKFFSLSPDYASQHFPSDAPTPDTFFYVRPGRPFIIMNDNIIHRVAIDGSDETNVVQLPNQATPVSSGAAGKTPDEKVIGNGYVESYGYNATLEQTSATSSPVDLTIHQPYSLIDSVSTSSAYFANAIAEHVEASVKHPEKRKSIAAKMRDELEEHHKKNLLAEIAEDITDLGHVIEKSLEKIVSDKHSYLADIIPRYNYWPVTDISSNNETLYTDGGTLDNTGIIGLISQTDNGEEIQAPLFVVAFDNTSTPLEKIKGKIIAGAQAAPLFGLSFDTETGQYQPFTEAQKDPKNKRFDATSLIQIFANEKDADGETPFDKLVEGLYVSSCGTSETLQSNEQENTLPAFYELSLTTVENSLAHISSGRTVEMLYIQNALMRGWQDNIGDSELKREIEEGQKTSLDPFLPFKNFPYYSTFLKVGLEPKESNALSQMWAWAVADEISPLRTALQTFLNGAK